MGEFKIPVASCNRDFLLRTDRGQYSYCSNQTLRPVFCFYMLRPIKRYYLLCTRTTKLGGAVNTIVSAPYFFQFADL